MAITFPRWVADLLDIREQGPTSKPLTPPAAGGPAGPDMLCAGDIFAFRITPFYEFSDPIPERYGAIKVLAANTRRVVFAALDGVWAKAPTLRQVGRRSVLVERRWHQAPRPAAYAIAPQGFALPALADPVRVGTIALTGAEMRLADGVRQYAGLGETARAVEGEQRWRNDRAAFLAETDESDLRDSIAIRVKEEHDEARLASLTWATWASRPLFETWPDAPPSPEASFTLASRDRIRTAGGDLQTLGPRRRKADVRRILKACVIAFNAADEAAGGMIETKEREDIYFALADLASLGGHPSLMAEVDVWRAW